MKMFFQILTIVSSLIVIISVVAQKDKSGGLSGAISGGASESAWAQGKGRSFEVILNKVIIIAAVLIVVASVGLAVI